MSDGEGEGEKDMEREKKGREKRISRFNYSTVKNFSFSKKTCTTNKKLFFFFPQLRIFHNFSFHVIYNNNDDNTNDDDVDDNWH